MMTEKTYTCIVCPKSCRVSLRDGSGTLTVTGNGCKRGAAYARAEHENPVRMITTTVRIEGGELPVLPVISTGEVPKSYLKDCMAAIYAASVRAPVRQGDAVLRDILGLGVDIVAARDIKNNVRKRNTV
ncbi:MAG: DUF1667 domain-containing protein [Bacillota bacterium]